MLDRPPPAGFSRWTGPLIAAELGDVHEPQVWRFLRAQQIDLDGRKSWCESEDPDFVVKAADVVGLYIAPPENAVVICVDEKPSIQALERAQGYLKLPNGRTLTGHSHDYKRNGTSTLFAACQLEPFQACASTWDLPFLCRLGIPSASSSDPHPSRISENHRNANLLTHIGFLLPKTLDIALAKTAKIYNTSVGRRLSGPKGFW